MNLYILFVTKTVNANIPTWAVERREYNAEQVTGEFQRHRIGGHTSNIDFVGLTVLPNGTLALRAAINGLELGVGPLGAGGTREVQHGTLWIGEGVTSFRVSCSTTTHFLICTAVEEHLADWAQLIGLPQEELV